MYKRQLLHQRLIFRFQLLLSLILGFHEQTLFLHLELHISSVYDVLILPPLAVQLSLVVLLTFPVFLHILHLDGPVHLVLLPDNRSPFVEYHFFIHDGKRSD